LQAAERLPTRQAVYGLRGRITSAYVIYAADGCCMKVGERGSLNIALQWKGRSVIFLSAQQSEK